MVQVMLEVNSESLCCVVHACLPILGHQQYHCVLRLPSMLNCHALHYRLKLMLISNSVSVDGLHAHIF